MDKILTYMDEYHMWPENGNVVAGVSGGADSVCLLSLLVRLRNSSGQISCSGHGREQRPFCGLKLTVVHVNHKIRREAAEDAAYVRMLCEGWQVPFILVEEDVEALAQKEKISCEEAGRQVRYRAFRQALSEMDEGSGTRGCIAVAHNRDDRAETLLFHMFRGSGLEGMGSIRPVRKNEDGSRIIRPLLSCSRKEIEDFLRAEGLEWKTDRTNAEDLYTRNRIRNRVLPYVEKEICPQAKGHLAREAALLADTADFVRKKTQEALARCSKDFSEKGERHFEAAAFLREDPFLQDHMLMDSVEKFGQKKDMTTAHIEQIKKLFLPSCTSGRRIALPILQLCVYRQFHQVIFKKETEPAKTAKKDADREKTEILLTAGSFFVPGMGEVRARFLPGPAAEGRKEGDRAVFLQNIPEKKYTKWFDYDKIIQSAMFRTRRTGDYLTINDALEKKSLKRYMIEEKIPAERRNGLMLFADGAHVIWVPGHRISAVYKVSAKTKTVLEIVISQETEKEIYAEEESEDG
ncbi:MAG: tRNA lysidine(34) synthetase TilS [Eubacteriales bacterium]|nr:tRNA lysidine(34) synthetase TilS [Eubacteriales bacterium]